MAQDLKFAQGRKSGALGAKLLPNSSCPSCGRDYSYESTSHCVADDDCPSFFEERGVSHPAHLVQA